MKLLCPECWRDIEAEDVLAAWNKLGNHMKNDHDSSYQQIGKWFVEVAPTVDRLQERGEKE